MKKFLLFLLSAAGFILCAAPEGFCFSDNDIKTLGLRFDQANVKIPGLKKTYRFLWLSDLHVMAQDVSEIEKKWNQTGKNKL